MNFENRQIRMDDSDSFELERMASLKAKYTMNMPPIDESLQISHVGFVFITLNAIIGTGVLGFGDDFRNGVIPTLVTNILAMGLNLAAVWILFRCAQITECYSYSEIWDAAFGEKTRIIPTIMLIILSFGIIEIFYTLILSTFGTLINAELTITNKTVYKNNFFILLIVWLVGVAPACFAREIRRLVIPSMVAMATVALLLIYTIYTFGGQYRYNHHVFDPAKQFRWAANVDIGRMIQSFLFGYTYVPLLFPTILALKTNESHELSMKKMMKSTGIALTITFVVYELFGLFSYFTLFDINTGATYLSYFRTATENRFNVPPELTIVACVLAIVLLILSIPLYLVAGGDLCVSFWEMEPSKKYKVSLITKLVVTFVLALLTCATVYVSKVISILVDISSTFLCFMFVPLTWFIFKGMEDKPMFAIVLFMAIVSVAVLGFVIYYEVHVW